MSRTMYDSTNVADLPAHAAMVAAYIDGAYDNYAQALHRFGGPVVPISVTGTGLHRVPAGISVALDVETGALSPDSAVEHFTALLHGQRIPVIYCSLSLWPEINAKLDHHGVPRRHRLRWIAHYTGREHLIRGSIATQWADPDHGSGGHYDVSAVRDYWPGIDRPPGTPLRPTTRIAARTLQRRLAKRNKPVRDTPDKRLLDQVAHQIERVREL